MEKLYGKDLTVLAYKARLLAVEAVHRASSGHPGGSLSCADALTALYFNEMNIDPANPQWSDRDRFVLSKGHCAPALYAVLALRGFFPVEDLQQLRSIKSHLSGHPDMRFVPGVDMSTGSLGQGLSTAVGMALSAKIEGKAYRTYAICGDGEVAEGQIWEAMMSAAKWELDNLCAFIDVNGLQIDGATKDVMPTEPLDQKLAAFNWHVIKIDGHDMEQILAALAEARTIKGKPTAILMHTVKGKGVSFMENQAGWHGKAPNAEEFAVAKQELEARIHELEEN
ncbi:MAG: transketolase [Oscillospiraceae bacterium]|nr:transketolase [Oscillospiraceae bacterium]